VSVPRATALIVFEVEMTSRHSPSLDSWLNRRRVADIEAGSPFRSRPRCHGGPLSEISKAGQAPGVRGRGQVIRGDVCRYLEFRDIGTVHTSRDLTAHRKDAGDWWDRHLNPITDQTSGRVATYLVRPRRQDPPTAALVFALDVAGTRYTGEGKGWLLAELAPGRYRAVEQAPDEGRTEYPATEILAWDEADAVTKRHQQ
jgi:hypothetical protein